MEKESIYDELHHSKYDWNSTYDSVNSQAIDLKLIKNISSKYLFKTCEADSFEYVEVTCESQYHYRFTVLTNSIVDFISMPFAIRIFGDASIISILHSKGIQEKKNPVWGRKLSMDFYEKLPSNQKFEFTILLSNPIEKETQCVIVARFKSSCKKCSGSIIISYEK